MAGKKSVPGILTALLDVLLIGAALLVFAYFHHVRGRTLGEAKQSIVFGETTPAPESAADPVVPDDAPDDGDAPAPAVPAASLGDFSATFPTEPVGADALKSYQDDGVRVAVTAHTGDNLAYYVADVWVKDIRRLKTAFASGVFATGTKYFEMPVDVAKANNAIVAITGDFSSYRDSGVVIRNGDLYRDTKSTEDVCILYADGAMETFYADEFDLDAAIARGAYQSWSFGPKLIDNGARPAAYNCSDAVKSRNPRSAIGYYEPGHYCLVVVDGRQDGYSKGLDMAGLTDLFLSLGCKEAFNLDGGQTAAMVFDGALVSRPYKDGREIADLIYIG